MSTEVPPPPPPPEADRPEADRPESSANLVPPEHTERLRSRWEDIQTRFVDEPQRSLREADELVNDVIDHIRDTFDARRAELEGRWNRDETVSTEQLRQSLRRYREFFDQLLTTR